MLLFKDVPMPPTVNGAYSNANNGGRTKSAAYKAYLKLVDIWCYSHQQQINMARKTMSKELYILLYVFKFDINKIVNTSRKVKDRVAKIDTSNRIKIVEDVVSDLVGVDDRYFFDSLAVKRIGHNTVDVYAYPITDIVNLMNDYSKYNESLVPVMLHLGVDRRNVVFTYVFEVCLIVVMVVITRFETQDKIIIALMFIGLVNTLLISIVMARLDQRTVLFRSSDGVRFSVNNYAGKYDL